MSLACAEVGRNTRNAASLEAQLSWWSASRLQVVRQMIGAWHLAKSGGGRCFIVGVQAYSFWLSALFIGVLCTRPPPAAGIIAQ